MDNECKYLNVASLNNRKLKVMNKKLKVINKKLKVI